MFTCLKYFFKYNIFGQVDILINLGLIRLTFELIEHVYGERVMPLKMLHYFKKTNLPKGGIMPKLS